MWSHYANEHKGFCLGFNKNILQRFDDSIFHMPVIYQTEFPYEQIFNKLSSINASREYLESHVWQSMLLPVVSTKYTNWSYERELRLMKPKYGAVSFKPSSLKSVAFGLKMSERDKATLKNLLSGSDWIHLKWYQAKKVNGCFSVEFFEV